MSVAPFAGVVALDNFKSPTSGEDGIQGQVPKPLAGQTNYVLTASGFFPVGSLPGVGTVTSVGTSGSVNGITLTGGPITSSGTVTLGGTLDLSSPPAIGSTTPSTGTFTTLTAQTEVLKGTGNNLYLYSSSLTNGAWTVANLTVTGGQTDPFGGTTAALLTDTTTPSVSHSIRQIPSNVGSTYTLSVYAKAGTSNYIGLANASSTVGSIFNLTTGAVTANWNGAPISTASTNIGNGWWRLVITLSVSSASGIALFMSEDGTNWSFTGTGQTVYIAAPQYEVGSTANTYVATTSSAIYGTPSLSFSGVAGLGLQSDGSLYVSPAGTGAIQAQATTSSATGGNARGANAVDWQTSRTAATNVASGGPAATLGGGQSNTVSASSATVAGGQFNNASNFATTISGGNSNSTSGAYSAIVGGALNTATGYYNFIGAGFTNSGTANASVTTQSGTMNGTTAVTLSGSNASIKVGQFISGTSIANNTYVAAISGTSLTLSQAASGSSTSTLSFYTPHGVVVGGGNNQATGSYSFIGGGGDAGTAANRNVASGAWSTVVGGAKNVASGVSSFVGGGGTDGAGTYYSNTASGTSSVISGGWNNNNSGGYGTIAGGQSNTVLNTLATVGGGTNNYASGANSTIIGGSFGTSRGIAGNQVFPAHASPISSAIYGASQSALLILGRQTTDATATVLTSDTSAATTTNQVILPNNSAYTFKGTMIANVTGGGNTSSWEFRGCIKRGAGVGTTALVGTPRIDNIGYDAGASTWAFTLTADTTNGGLAVTVTGQASTTIRWVATINTCEVTY